MTATGWLQEENNLKMASGQTPPESVGTVIHESLAEMGAPVAKTDN